MMQGGPSEELIYEDVDSDMEMPGLVSDSEDSDSESDLEMPSDPSLVNDHGRDEVMVDIESDANVDVEMEIAEQQQRQAQRRSVMRNSEINSPHPGISPQSQLEDAVSYISQLLRKKPTLPYRANRKVYEDDGVILPEIHCAFEGCTWCYSNSSNVAESTPRKDPEEMLEEHLNEMHGAIFQNAFHQASIEDYSENGKKIETLHLYCEAIASVERRKVPTVGSSIDRRYVATLAKPRNRNPFFLKVL